MNAGKIVELDAANTIYEHPQQEYTRNLIEAIPLGRVDEIRARMDARGSV